MFFFEEPFDVNDDWYLGAKPAEKLSNDLLRNISSVHMVGIQYLFDNYVKKRGGAILNEDEDLNMPLQVCAFLSSVKERIHQKSPVLVISSEYSVCKWHYHASEVGFKPQIITSESFDNSDTYILNSDLLKLAVNLLDQNLFCVVMDDFDTIATKLLVKKIRGSFNIGLTKRSFYKEPDQKLKWSMLNWASPGCVGKLNDFYRIDRLHSLAFSDNYRFWWMRLTWKFCDSFEQPNEEDLKEYQQKLQEWGKLHNIPICYKPNLNLKRSRDKKQPTPQKKKTKYEEKNADNSLNFSDSSFSIPSSPEEIRVKTENFVENSNEVQEIAEKEDSSDTNLPKKVKNEPAEFAKNIESDEIFPDLIKNVNKDELRKINYKSSPSHDYSVEKVKTESMDTIEDVRSNDYEPILSIIYSQVSDNILPKYSSHVSKSSENNSNFLPFLDTQTSSRSQTFRQISDVLDNLSDVESDNKANSDDDSFFTELITGKK